MKEGLVVEDVVEVVDVVEGEDVVVLGMAREKLLEDHMDGLAAAKDAGLKVKINAVEPSTVMRVGTPRVVTRYRIRV